MSNQPAAVRRSRAKLEAGVESAGTVEDQARAHFELALFHDNNSREAEAIPHYEAALRLGLAGETRAECLAWLASSLYKSGKPDEALARVQAASQATHQPELMKFLVGLERRAKTKSVLLSTSRS